MRHPTPSVLFIRAVLVALVVLNAWRHDVLGLALMIAGLVYVWWPRRPRTIVTQSLRVDNGTVHQFRNDEEVATDGRW